MATGWLTAAVSMGVDWWVWPLIVLMIAILVCQSWRRAGQDRQRKAELARGAWSYGRTDAAALTARFPRLPGTPNGEQITGQHGDRTYLAFAISTTTAEHVVRHLVVALPLPGPPPEVRQWQLSHQGKRLTARLGPEHLLVWQRGLFDAKSVRWLIECANDLLDGIQQTP